MRINGPANVFPRFASPGHRHIHIPKQFCSVLLCVLCGLIPLAARAELRAGAARVSITPDPVKLPYTLGGYGDMKRFKTKATGVHDTCYARALVLENGGTKCAMVSLDLCFLPANVKDAVVSRLGPTSIPANAIFLSATHSHSAPDPLLMHSGNRGPAGELPRFDQALLDFTADRIAQAVTEADSKLAPAQVGSGQKSGIGLNRNRRGEKITDDEMTALKVTDPNGKTIAAVIDYAAHPVYYGAEMMEVSGDWVGCFEREMEAVTPGAVVLFINGAEGDASPNGSDAGTNSEKIQIYAAKLMEPTRALLGSITTEPNPKLSAWVQSTTLPVRSPHPLFLLAAASLKATPDQAKALVNQLMPEKVDVCFLRIRDALFICVPGEPTTPVGLAAKEMARQEGVKHPAIVALTNGWIGYLVTAEQYKAGKYEPTMSFYGPGIGNAILAGIQAGLKRL